MPEPSNVLIFLLSVGILIVTLWMAIKRRHRRIKVKMPPEPPRLASPAEMAASIRHIALGIIVGFIMIGVGAFVGQGNLVIPIGAMVLAINGLSLLVKTWASAADTDHSLDE
jgi:hypothetical protein